MKHVQIENPADQRRTVILPVRLTPHEYNLLWNRALKQGVDISKLIRIELFGTAGTDMRSARYNKQPVGEEQDL